MADTNKNVSEKISNIDNIKKIAEKHPEHTDKKKSLLTNEDAVFDVSQAFDTHTESGTIVSDQKYKRWKFTEAVGSALSGWIGKKQKAIETFDPFKEPKKPKIAPASTREDVIIKATEKSQLAPKDDHEIVLKKIQSHKDSLPKPPSTAYNLKERKEKSAPIWSHTSEKKVEDQRPQKNAHLERHHVKNSPEKTSGEWLSLREEKNKAPSQTIEKIIPVSPSLPERDTQTEIPAHTTPGLVEAITNTQATTPPNDGQDFGVAYRIGLIVVVGIAILGGIGVSILLFVSSSEPEIVEIQNTIPEGIIKTETQIKIPLSGNKEEFVDNLQTTLADSSHSLAEIVPTISNINTSSEKAATSEEIFAVIEPSAPGAFIRSVKPHMMIGMMSTPENKPFLILQSDSFDTAFAGMIAWEPNLRNDFSPLFGTIDVPESNDFTDTSIQNHAARVLRDEHGDIQILYSFVNRNTVVITTASVVLEVIIDAL